MPSASQLLSTVPNLIGQALAFAANRAPQWATGDRNFVGKIGRMVVALLADFFNALRQLDADWPPSNQSSPESLQRGAEVFGLSNNAGGYGFKVAQPARGGQGIAQGTKGGTITLPQLLTGPDGVTIFELRAPASPYTIPGIPPGTGQVNVTIDAVTPGTVGNLSANQTLTFQTTPPGFDPEVVLFVGLKDGIDVEQPDAAFARLTRRLQLSPKGGAPQDYREWGETSTDANGVVYGNLRVYTYDGGDANAGAGGGYDGVLGVMSVVTQIGSGLARMPTVQQLIDVTAFIRGSTKREGLSPICASIRSVAPFMDPSVTGMVIKLRIVPSKQLYKYDWRRGATVYQVDALGWNGVSELRLTSLAPSDLKLAIQNGERPRIFVDTRDALGFPSGPVIPPMARCVAFADAGGKTTLTLETPLPVGWTAPNPAGGDEVYAGQELIAAPDGVPGAVLTYVDNLGPSRISGLQAPNDVWEDTAAIQGGIDTAAKNVLAADGITPLIERCLVGEVKIGIGNGALAAADVRAPDNSTFGPGMLYLLRVITSD